MGGALGAALGATDDYVQHGVGDPAALARDALGALEAGVRVRFTDDLAVEIDPYREGTVETRARSRPLAEHLERSAVEFPRALHLEEGRTIARLVDDDGVVTVRLVEGHAAEAFENLGDLFERLAAMVA